jgi:hypothetical protein
LSGEQPLHENEYNPLFIEHISNVFKKNGIDKFDYMMTTDADSEPSLNSAHDMII